ncbi:hypothetical protein [Streptomyces sp. NPDC001139]
MSNRIHAHVPAVDLTTAGHLPYTVQTATRHTALVDTDGAREHTEPTGSCPVFRDCTESEPGHYDHFAHSLKVTEDDGTTPVLTAGMVALSDDDPHAVVYLRNAEFVDAAAVHAKTAELRRMLDEVDAMATRVFADHAARAAVTAGGAA